MKATVEPILEADLASVGRFLHLHKNRERSAEDWARSLVPPWKYRGPNAGYLLRTEAGDIGGAYTAIYSERTINGRVERFCNLAVWCVLPELRAHSLSLLKKLLSTPGVSFTDLSARPEVVEIMKLFKFRLLESDLWVAPNVPGLWGATIVTDLDEIESSLSGSARDAFVDHRAIGSLQHVGVRAPAGFCHVAYHRGLRRGIPCATIMHMSSADHLRGQWSRLRGAFLAEGALLTSVETRLLKYRPPLAVRLPYPHPKMFKSPSLGPDDIDNLYSELVTLTTTRPIG